MPRSSSHVLPRRPLRLAAAGVVAVGVAGLIGLLILSIAEAAAIQPPVAGRPVDVWHLVRMTSIQAGLTTVLSIAAGIAVAWALNRLRFPGRDLLAGLFASAIVTPGLVVAFGLLSVWGRNGWINRASQDWFGVTLDIPIFGLGGILAAHVILDGAFAARILLARLDALPEMRLKTGRSLGLDAWQRFAVIDWPALRNTLPGLAAIIFLLAFTSFPIVLLLGGGPANQTLEVAIYSAVRLEFDLSAAVTLALVQIGICAIVIVAASVFAPVPVATGGGAGPHWPDGRSARLVQWTVLGLATAGFALPLVAVLVDGLGGGLGDVVARPTFWQATVTSLLIGLGSSILTLALALILGMGRAAVRSPLARIGLGVPAYAYLAVPAVVLSLGFFLFVRGFGVPPVSAAPVVVVVANALLALPFAVSTLGPGLDAIARTRGKLIRSLGLSGWRQFALVEWPLLGPDIGMVLSLSFCFSLGDLGVIALFGTQDFATLPLTMLRALGAYRSNDAAAIAAIMLIGTILAFVAIPRVFARLSRAVA